MESMSFPRSQYIQADIAAAVAGQFDNRTDIKVVGTECVRVNAGEYYVAAALRKSTKVYAFVAICTEVVEFVDDHNGACKVSFYHEDDGAIFPVRLSPRFLAKLTKPTTEAAWQWRINAATFGL